MGEEAGETWYVPLLLTTTIPNVGSLQEAYHFVLNVPFFADYLGQKDLGLKILLEASIPDVFYDSSAQDLHPHATQAFATTF
ncbi:hypothetical protein P691DRAFT_760799 [Macrolepiota fuliginosa MF-IS2]|uniref:Uncharacterized protein n=1 Tax=Macrolepiota fuliginosa MF-IS2 TaxID=1400762 RepID=A0A9P5XD69_9AGAR|nr:hypothetical protein P691DRAFT_760799 [Macrolepiota fuliginosa MF-IS2]